MSTPIEDYALIGDCETAALVGRDGSVDWLCLPRFDSAASFASLLGDPSHGRWLIAPAEKITRVRRRYRASSLILETDFETANGAVRVTDFMTRGDGDGAGGGDGVAGVGQGGHASGRWRPRRHRERQWRRSSDLRHHGYRSVSNQET